MSSPNERISDVELGERLRLAREKAEIKQSEAAEIIGVARTTIVAIEQGQRKIRIPEIQLLAGAYHTSVNALYRIEAVHLDLAPQFRKLSGSSSDEVSSAAVLLNSLVSAELELENALGAKKLRNYPPEKPILPGNVSLQAEADAQDLRDWLGLGHGPLSDVISLMELQMGLRVYIKPLSSKISGLFAFDPAAGGCILLNGNHPDDRIAQSAVHELGHFISTRNEPEALLADERFQSRSEKYATTFGRAFISPARSVRQMFADLTSGQSHLTRRHIILLSSHFGISREAMVRRLEELSLVRQGTWEWFEANGGITNQQVEEVLGKSFEPRVLASRSALIVPHRLALLAREASKRGIYSESQLARLLDIDLHSIREVLDGVDEEVVEQNEQFEIPR